MRKTKIVCTLGPATDGEGVLREMMLAGMNVARFNFSHGTHPEHKARLEQVKALRQELDLPVSVHDREAHAEMYELLRQYRPRGVLHCYSGSVEDAAWLTAQGMARRCG